jgi:hypothetical protein
MLLASESIQYRLCYLLYESLARAEQNIMGKQLQFIALINS